MKKVQKTLLLCTVISAYTGSITAESLYDDVWHRVRKIVFMKKEYHKEGERCIPMYQLYMLGFMREHTVSFKNYKSKDLIPKLETYLNKIEDRNKSSQCPILFGGKEFRKFMLQISEEFLLEGLLFWRDYKKATGPMLEYPCERLCAPVIVHFYRMQAERKWMEQFEPNDAQRFEQIFDKRLKRFEQMRLGKLCISRNDGFIPGTAEKICKALFGGEDVYKRLKDVILEIEILIEKAIDSVDYFDCNYWKPEPIGEKEGRKILEESE